MRTSSQRVHCREVVTADFDAIAGLLAGGFATSREHWLRILKRLEERPAFPSLPRYGYLLECDDGPVGAILLIFSAIRLSEQTTIRCNVCSWHVRPPFNIYAGMLASRALRLKDVTYVNVAPAPNTLPILKAQGYSRYSYGWYAAIPSILG